MAVLIFNRFIDHFKMGGSLSIYKKFGRMLILGLPQSGKT